MQDYRRSDSPRRKATAGFALRWHKADPRYLSGSASIPFTYMKFRQTRLGLATLVLGIACAAALTYPSSLYAAATYKVTLPSDLTAGDTKLKSGEYSISFEGKLVIFKKGKVSVQIPAIVDKNDSKFSATTLEIMGSNLQAIDLGGTDIKIVFRATR